MINRDKNQIPITKRPGDKEKKEVLKLRSWEKIEDRKLGKLEVMKIRRWEKIEVRKLRSWEDLWERASARDNRARQGSPTIYVSTFG